MSLVIHGDNFIELQRGQAVRNVEGSAGDTITIKFNGHYFVSNQYSSYVRQLITNRHIIDPPVNQNINPTSWLGVWQHFTNNHEETVTCCVCNRMRATVGGHAVLGNQNREVEHGSDSVFIIPICTRCNGQQNGNLTINRDIQAVKLFDYYNSYYSDSFVSDTENRIGITYIEISSEDLIQMQNNEQNAGADYGNIDQQGRQGRTEQQGRQIRPNQRSEYHYY